MFLYKNMEIKEYYINPFNGLPAKFFTEFIGCMIFHFIGSVAPTAMANAIVLMVLIYFTAKISGGHLNPAVSWTFMLLGHINPFEMFIYWIAQISGCIIGALWIAALIPSMYIRKLQTPIDYLYDGCFIPNNQLSKVRIFGWEAFCTFNFILPIFAVVWHSKLKDNYGYVGPIIIGLSLYANVLAAGFWTGGAFNPARVFGSPAIFNCGNNSSIFYYVIGEITGATAAVLVIIPWYGIAKHSWYIHKVPKKISNKLNVFTSSCNTGVTKIIKDKREDQNFLEKGLQKIEHTYRTPEVSEQNNP
jgi:glycerol uptake facilitator-like aquaporin